MAASRIVVVGASGGGIDAISSLLAVLPADFPAAICVVVHVGQDSPGLTAPILGRATALSVSFAADGMRIQGGHVYVAPAAHHLLVEPGKLLLRRGPKENGFRPAIDPLFRSAAQVYGPNAVGVLMSGALDDGTSGLHAIKRLGGIALVQDPREAQVRSMPESAIRHVVIDCIGTAAELARVLDDVARTPHHELHPLHVPTALDIEVQIAKERNPLEIGFATISTPSLLTCPDCHGVLSAMEDGTIVRFRCHTGHAYSAKALVEGLERTIQDSLWSAVRALEEGSLLLGRLAARLSPVRSLEIDDLTARSREARRDAEIVRRLAIAREELTSDIPAPARAIAANR